MKKDYSFITVIAFIVLFILGIVGIWHERQAEEKTRQEAKYEEPVHAEFMEAASKAATMVSDTIKPEREYLIDFELISSDGNLAVIEQRHLTLDVNDERKVICRDRLIHELETSVNDYWVSGKSVTLRSVAVLSPDYNEDGSGAGVWEYYDSDADGAWDYCRYC